MLKLYYICIGRGFDTTGGYVVLCAAAVRQKCSVEPLSYRFIGTENYRIPADGYLRESISVSLAANGLRCSRFAEAGYWITTKFKEEKEDFQTFQKYGLIVTY